MAIFNRLISKSTNTSMYRAYMHAVLEVTGMMSGQRFPLGLFMGHMDTHLAPKISIGIGAVLEKLENCDYVLTKDGFEFFAKRLTETPMQKGRRVTRAEVIEMIRIIVAPDPLKGWESFSVELRDDALKVQK